MPTFLSHLVDIEQYKNQKDYIFNNPERVRRQNFTLLQISTVLYVLLMTTLTLLSLCFSELKFGRPVYIISAVTGLIFYICTRSILQSSRLSPLPFLYLFYLICMWMASEDAIFLNHGEGSAAAFCGIILVFSMLTIDHSYRINLFIIIVTIGFIICSYLFEARRYAVRDISNAIIFCILSVIIGYIPRLSKLKDFESERILQIERNIDTLTKIANRRSLFEALIKSESDSCKDPYTGAIMMDIDHFKRYNDTYGHQAGDRVLQQIGCFLGDFSIDFKFDVFRYGGEEFLALTKDATPEKLKIIAENLVNTVQALSIPYQASKPGIVTISAGYVYAEETENIKYEKLIQQADTALYAAKKAGRNQAIRYAGQKAAPDPSAEDESEINA
jgi:diguanylate cyclase (GGDEF)-like protein